MYNKDQFIYYVRTSSCFTKLAAWVSRYSRRDNRAAITKRLDKKPMSSMEVYLEEAGKFYANLKCYPTEKMVLNESCISVGDMVYDYKPLSAVPFLGVMYAMTKTDIRDYYGEDRKKGEIIFEALSRIDSVASDALYGLMRDLHPMTGDDFTEERYEAIKQQDEKRRAQMVSRIGDARNMVVGHLKNKPISNSTNNAKFSNIYAPELRADEIKRNAIASAIRYSIYPAIKNPIGTREDKWKWPHLQEALFRSKLILTKDNKNAFGRAMEQVTGEPWNNVAQRFKEFKLKPTDENIITQMQECIDDAIAGLSSDKKNAEAEKLDMPHQEKVHDNAMVELYAMNVTLGNVVQHIMILESYFMGGNKKENLLEAVSLFAKKCQFALDKFEPKRERHAMCQIIHRLQNVGFIRRDVPTMELAIQLAKSFDADITYQRLRDKMMSCDHESLPDDHRLVYELFENHMKEYLRNHYNSREGRPEGDAHVEYLRLLDFNEKTALENTVCVVMSTEKYFQPWMNEGLVRNLVKELIDSPSTIMVANGLTGHQSMSTMVRVVSALYDLGAHVGISDKTQLRGMLSRVTKLNSAKLHRCLMSDNDEYKCIFNFLKAKIGNMAML